MTDDPTALARALAADALARDDATGWFDDLYAAAGEGRAVVPWDRGAPHPLLEAWVRETLGPDAGRGRRALVVGAGYGTDAELLAGLGFATTAFDVSPTAVAAAQARHAGSAVSYEVADLLDLPPAYRAAFHLVVESLTVQSMPLALRATSTASVAGTVAPGGTLLVIATARDEDAAPDGPPWPLSRREVEAFADGLQVVAIERHDVPGDPPAARWRAAFTRPAA